MELNYTFVDTVAGVAEVLPRLHSMPMYAVDVETTGLSPFNSDLLMLQIGNREHQFVFDARKVTPTLLRGILQSNKPKCLHNAKFDYSFIRHHSGVRMRNLVDTYLIENLLLNGQKKEGGFSLQDTYKRYTGVEIDKSPREMFIEHTGDFTDTQVRYAAADIFVTIDLACLQTPRLVEDELEHIAQVECLCVPAVADMELDGFKLDADAWRAHVSAAEEEAEAVRAELMEFFHPYLMRDEIEQLVPVAHDMNWDSDQQVLEALQFMGIKVESTGKEVLKPLVKKHPILGKVLHYRELRKLATSYGKGFLEHINPQTGRVHCEFRQAGTESGRFSAAKPNLQQVPAGSKFRQCFVAEPGNKLVTADYNGAELRIIAEYSGDPVFKRVFEEGGDLHSVAAELIFGKKVSKTENADLRQASKTISFGLAYGAGPHNVAQRLGITRKQAQQIIDQYFDTFPKIKQYLDFAGATAIEQSYSTTLGGRRRYYDVAGARGDKGKLAAIERKGRNLPIQGTNADITKAALHMLRRVFMEQKLAAWLVNTVHDEIVVECAKEIADEVTDLVATTMQQAGEIYLKSVPVEVDAHADDCWSK